MEMLTADMLEGTHNFKLGDIVVSSYITGNPERGRIVHIEHRNNNDCSILVTHFTLTGVGHDGQGTYNFPRDKVKNAWWYFPVTLSLCEETVIDRVLEKYS